MKQHWIAAIGIAMVMGMGAPVMAAETGGSTAASNGSAAAHTAPASRHAVQPKMRLSAVEGAITALDLKAVPASVTITEKDNKARTFTFVSTQVSVKRNGQPITADQLKTGDWIRIDSVMDNGKPVVKTIRVYSGAPKAAPTSPAASTAPAHTYSLWRVPGPAQGRGVVPRPCASLAPAAIFLRKQ